MPQPVKDAVPAGVPVPGSPFACTVAAGPVHAARSRLFGPGLTSVQLGRDCHFHVELADSFGNCITAADPKADAVQVQIQARDVAQQTFACTSCSSQFSGAHRWACQQYTAFCYRN